MEYVSTTAGLFPPPEESLEDEADEPEQSPDRERAAREAVVAAQRAAGLDRIVEGQVGWRDLLAHPLVGHDAVELRGEAPYYDTDHTYRHPAVVDDLTPGGDLAAELEATAKLTDRLQAVVPGPYTLADLATDEHYGDDAEFLAAVAEFLAGEVEAFPDVETLFLLEPSLVAHPPGDGPDARASDAVDDAARAADCPVVVYPSRGALTEKVHAHLLDADVAAVGYDFVRAPDANLHLVNEFGTKDDLALGLVDAASAVVESPELVAERIEWVVENTPPVIEFDTTYVTTSAELRWLPWDVVHGKLAALAEGVALARDAGEGSDV